MVEHYGNDGPDVPALWTRFAALTPHLGPVGVVDDKDPNARDLVLRHVRYLHACGDTEGCGAFGAFAVERLTVRAGACHPGVTVLTELLADLLPHSGDAPGTGPLPDGRGTDLREPDAT